MVTMRPYRVTDGLTVLRFLHDGTWPFHGGPALTLAEADARFDPTAYASDVVETWWLDDKETTVGLVRLFDLCDDTAMFDLRIHQAHRGRGIGTSTVRWLTDHVFTSRSCTRIEATTRQDNIAMCCCAAGMPRKPTIERRGPPKTATRPWTQSATPSGKAIGAQARGRPLSGMTSPNAEPPAADRAGFSRADPTSCDSLGSAQ